MAGIDRSLAMGLGKISLTLRFLFAGAEKDAGTPGNPLPEFRHAAGIGHAKDRFPTEFDVSDRLLETGFQSGNFRVEQNTFTPEKIFFQRTCSF